MSRSACEKAAAASRTLWLSVLELALEDYRQRRERRDYFESQSFREVCDLAGVEPGTVLELVCPAKKAVEVSCSLAPQEQNPILLPSVTR